MKIFGIPEISTKAYFIITMMTKGVDRRFRLDQRLLKASKKPLSP